MLLRQMTVSQLTWMLTVEMTVFARWLPAAGRCCSTSITSCTPAAMPLLCSTSESPLSVSSVWCHSNGRCAGAQGDVEMPNECFHDSLAIFYRTDASQSPSGQSVSQSPWIEKVLNHNQRCLSKCLQAHTVLPNRTRVALVRSTACTALFMALLSWVSECDQTALTWPHYRCFPPSDGRSLSLEDLWSSVTPCFRRRLQKSPLNTITLQVNMEQADPRMSISWSSSVELEYVCVVGAPPAGTAFLYAPSV